MVSFRCPRFMSISPSHRTKRKSESRRGSPALAPCCVDRAPSALLALAACWPLSGGAGLPFSWAGGFPKKASRKGFPKKTHRASSLLRFLGGGLGWIGRTATTRKLWLKWSGRMGAWIEPKPSFFGCELRPSSNSTCGRTFLAEKQLLLTDRAPLFDCLKVDFNPGVSLGEVNQV